MHRRWEEFIGALPPTLGFMIFTPLGIFFAGSEHCQTTGTISAAQALV
jgi:hypothetical protein